MRINITILFYSSSIFVAHIVLSESSVDMDHHPDVTNDHKAISELSVDMDQQPEVNNDILSTITEVSPQIKIAPEFINSHAGTKSTESTDNLEQSIRNSVKTEIEMEQGLEPSPVLEILKDIAEPEIRKTLTEDLIEPTLNQNNESPYIDFEPEENVGHIESMNEIYIHSLTNT